mgnify:CR=1 FL=1
MGGILVDIRHPAHVLTFRQAFRALPQQLCGCRPLNFQNCSFVCLLMYYHASSMQLLG